MPPEEYSQKVAGLLEEIEKEAEEAREKEAEEARKKKAEQTRRKKKAEQTRRKKMVVGMSVIQEPDPHYRPGKTKRSPEPRFHASDVVYPAMVAEYREFLVNYRAAAKQLKSSELGSELGFPAGCYPPALPFVGALHEPWTPAPPPTRQLVRDDDGEVIFRGEIPVVVVPGRSPPGRDPPP